MLPDTPRQLTQQDIATVCVYCERVRLASKPWQQKESCRQELLTKYLSHGACPSCFQEALDLLEAEIKRETESSRVAC